MDVIMDNVLASGLITQDILAIKSLLNDLKTLTANPSLCDYEAIKKIADYMENHSYHISSICNNQLNK